MVARQTSVVSPHVGSITPREEPQLSTGKVSYAGLSADAYTGHTGRIFLLFQFIVFHASQKVNLSNGQAAKSINTLLYFK
jgi:hypothetical protein